MKITDKLKKFMDSNWKHGSHNVQWWLLNVGDIGTGRFNISKRFSNKKLNSIAEERANDVCYSGLRRPIIDNRSNKNNKDFTYLITHIPLNDYPKKTLTATEMRNWIRLSKKYGTLPYYLVPKHVVGDKKVLKATFRLNSISNFPLLYVYLATLRYIKEDPGLVKIVLHLVKKYNIDYFVALNVATYHGARQKGHNIMSNGGSYPKPRPIIECTYNLRESLTLKTFVNGPTKYYKNTLKSDSGWDMFFVLGEIPVKTKCKVSFSELDSKKVVKFMNSGVQNV